MRVGSNALIALLIGFIVYFVVVLAICGFPSLQHGEARVGSIAVTRAIKVQMAHHYDNRIIDLVYKFNVLSAEYLFTGKKSVFFPIQAIGNSRWNNCTNFGVESLVHFRGEPFICLFQGVSSKKYRSVSADLDSRGFSVVHQEELGRNRGAHRMNGGRFYRRNNVRPLIAVKLRPVFDQRVSSDFSKLIGGFGLFSNLPDEQICLLPTILHFFQLSVHRTPLTISDSDAGYRNGNDKPSQKNHPFFSGLSSVLKVVYGVTLFVIALAICCYSGWQIVRKWSFRALLSGLVLYLIAGGAIFHAVWVMLFV
jgi:hypothetical protein